MKRNTVLLCIIFSLISCAFKGEDKVQNDKDNVVRNASMNSEYKVSKIPEIYISLSDTKIKNFSDDTIFLETEGKTSQTKGILSVASSVLGETFSTNTDIEKNNEQALANMHSIISLESIQKIKYSKTYERLPEKEMFLSTKFGLTILPAQNVSVIKNIIVEISVFDSSKNRKNLTIISKTLMKTPYLTYDVNIPTNEVQTTKNDIELRNIKLENEEVVELLKTGEATIAVIDFDYIQNGELKNYKNEMKQIRSNSSSVYILKNNMLFTYKTNQKNIGSFLREIGSEFGSYSDGVIRSIDGVSSTNTTDINPDILTDDTKDKASWYFLGIENNEYSAMRAGREYIIAYLDNLTLGKIANDIEQTKLNELTKYKIKKTFPNDEFIIKISLNSKSLPVLINKTKTHSTRLFYREQPCLTSVSKREPPDRCGRLGPLLEMNYQCQINYQSLEGFRQKDLMQELSFGYKKYSERDENIWYDKFENVIYLNELSVAEIFIRENDNQEELFSGYVSSNCPNVCKDVGCIKDSFSKESVSLNEYKTRYFNVEIQRNGARRE